MAAGIVAKESGTSSTLSTSQDYFPSSFVYPGSYMCQKAEGLFCESGKMDVRDQYIPDIISI